MTRTDMPADLYRIPNRRDYIDALDDVPTLDGHVIHEEVTFTPDEDTRRLDAIRHELTQHVPPVGWVPVPPHEPTPIFDALEQEWQWRTAKGRKSRLDMSYDAFVAASRAQHGTYTGGPR